MAKRTRCRRSRSRAKLCLGLSGLCGDTIIHTSFRSVWVAMKLAMTMCPVCTGLKEPKNRPIFEFILEKALNCMFSCRKYAMLAPALRVYRHCVSRARKTMRNALCLPALRVYGTKNHAKCSVPTGIACLWHEKPCEMLCAYRHCVPMARKTMRNALCLFFHFFLQHQISLKAVLRQKNFYFFRRKIFFGSIH